MPVSTAQPPVASRSWYEADIDAFLSSEPAAILGTLAKHGDFALLTTQRDTWLTQIALLKNALGGLQGLIFFEFSIPRMGRRIDVVLLIDSIVFALEFKVGADAADRSAIDQVWDYALDLKNFHEASHIASIVPILIATDFHAGPILAFHGDPDGVYRPITIGANDIRTAIDAAGQTINSVSIDAANWSKAPYRPTPTIIEAARALYAQHSVDAIARFDAGAKNLRLTSQRIDEIVDDARINGRKVICFVTGVPGAGKTLVGLNVATRHRRRDKETHAVFLSGNGPLVAVLREALIRDEVARRKAAGGKSNKGAVRNGVESFIQNIHHFRDEAFRDSAPTFEHVVIFDEAQRAWNLTQTANFMKRKKNRPGFSQSEPEFLIGYMDRHKDWAVIICLVGGGQEINTGEAGIGAWLEAVSKSYPHWTSYISSRLTDSEYSAGPSLAQFSQRTGTCFEDALHLGVSMRSFRAENVSAFVKAVLDRDRAIASAALEKLRGRYPICLTRSLPAAKEWIRSRARGSERYGIVASSRAQRLKPHAIDIRVNIDPIHWFLNERTDTRSSYYLEDAATEFQVQGLELDWTCVSWDGDLRYSPTEWCYHDFRGDRWTNVKNVENRGYLKNAYRVLLTRARQGMVLFIPEGDGNDPTRSPGIYDPTFEYLRSLGIPMLS